MAGDLATLLGADLLASGAAIARTQRADGAIPWYPRGPVDPWDHVEAAMALDLTGFHAEAVRAYAWLRRTQRPDGSWPWRVVRGRITDATGDANYATYVAVGVWHHLLLTGDERAAVTLWPTVERAVTFALALQVAGGEVRWARDPHQRPAPTALVTASCGVLLALRCAGALGEALGCPRPEWELAADRLARAIRRGGGDFAPAGRHAMDWYWPVLSGAVTGAAARQRLAQDWERFVVDGLGVRCVADRPWVTGAETCELAMGLALSGEVEGAAALWQSAQHLRDGDGSYWTGYVWPDDARWPVERTTWTAAAVIMAADALVPASATARVLRTGLVVDTA